MSLAEDASNVRFGLKTYCLVLVYDSSLHSTRLVFSKMCSSEKFQAASGNTSNCT